MVGAPVSRMGRDRRARAHEDFVMDTDGTVRVSPEICMRFTPLPGLRTHVCIALDPGDAGADSIAVTDSCIKSHHPVGKPFTI